MNNMSSQQVFNALLRLDFYSFCKFTFKELNQGASLMLNWHLECICHYLTEVYHGNIKRLIITLPPRSLKSHLASVSFPVWCLGHDPTLKIINASYSDDLAKTFSRQSRQIMNTARYEEVFPSTIVSKKKDAVGEFHTTKGGFRLATSVGGTLTGKGGNIILLDDILKPEEALSDVSRNRVNDWYANTLYSRLDNKAEDKIVIIMQRLHEDDLVGHLVTMDNDWTLVNIPAISTLPQEYELGNNRTYRRAEDEVLHEARESRMELEKIKRQKGGYHFAAQYQQTPVPLEGNFFKSEWIHYYENKELPSEFDRVVQSWDTASKTGECNDYSVCTTWGITQNNFYLLDVFREKLEYPDLKKAVIAQQQIHRAHHVLIEDAGSGTHLLSDLRATGPFKPILRRAIGDKKERAASQAIKFEEGSVLIPKDASWLGDFLSEILAFPGGRHDDQVDSVTHFLKWSEYYKKRLNPMRRSQPRRRVVRRSRPRR